MVISLKLLGTVLVVVHNCTCHRMLLLFLGSVVMFVCMTYYLYVYMDFSYLISPTPNSNFHPVQIFLTAHFETAYLLHNMSTYKLRIPRYN